MFKKNIWSKGRINTWCVLTKCDWGLNYPSRTIKPTTMLWNVAEFTMGLVGLAKPINFRDGFLCEPNNFLGITYSHISFYIKQEISVGAYLASSALVNRTMAFAFGFFMRFVTTSMNFSSDASEGTFSAIAMQMFLFSASRWNTSIPCSPVTKNVQFSPSRQK